MDTTPAMLADWLLRTTWQAAVLVALVGAAYLLASRRLAPRWRFALWGIVVVRLLLPALPSSPWSVFNFSPRETVAGRVDDLRGEDVGASGQTLLAATDRQTSSDFAAKVSRGKPRNGHPAALGGPPSDAGNVVGGAAQSVVVPRDSLGSPAAPAPSAGVTPRPFGWRVPLLVAWMSGALFVIARLALGSAVMRRRLRGATTPDADTLALLDRCRREMSLRATPPVLLTDAVAGPALFGFVRPKLLLPPGLVRQLTPDGLRFVFLHELAHLKRRDPLTNAALLLAGALHWFNPLARLAVARCRAERELACDELVMRATAPAARPAYGRAVLHVAEWLCAAGAGRPAAGVAPVLAMAAARSHLRRRISMIATFRDAPRRPARRPCRCCWCWASARAP